MRTTIVYALVGLAIATAAVPAVGATAVGACFTHCAVADTENHTHVENTVQTCSANGNVAIIVGDGSYAQYCSQSSSSAQAL